MSLYFAYGSNMDEAAMRTLCPRARVLGTARLAHHRFALMGNGYASVRPTPEADVHGVLYELAASDNATLDDYEDVAGGLYVKAMLPVTRGDGSIQEALVYLGTDTTAGRAIHAGYMEGVATAARAFALPDVYVAALWALVPLAVPRLERPS